jgi:hypothetical protein
MNEQVLALQAFTEYSVNLGRLRVTEERIEAFRKIMFQNYNADRAGGSSLFAKLFEVFLFKASFCVCRKKASNVMRSLLRLATRVQSEMSSSREQHSTLPKQAIITLPKVILASHVDPVKAFGILDSDGDGLLTIQDFIDMLKKLGLPLSQSDRDAFLR